MHLTPWCQSHIHGADIECLGVFLGPLLDPGEIALSKPGEDSCPCRAYTAVKCKRLNITLKSSNRQLKIIKSSVKRFLEVLVR